MPKKICCCHAVLYTTKAFDSCVYMPNGIFALDFDIQMTKHRLNKSIYLRRPYDIQYCPM